MWFENLTIGQEYIYSEEGTEVTVRLLEKEKTDNWVALALEAKETHSAGTFGAIPVGTRFAVGTALYEGYPNGYTGWHLRKLNI